MSKSTTVLSGKNNYLASAAMSFVGVLASVPVVMMLFSPGVPANAVQGDGNGYDQFAYAFTQGYLANANGSSDPCLDVGGHGMMLPEGSGAFSAAGGGGATAASFTAEPGRGNWSGNGNWNHDWNDDNDSGGNGNHYVRPEGHSGDLSKVIRDSYNHYSYITNSTYTNSNNTIGSHNSTSTSVSVSGRHNDVDVDTDSDITTETENTAIVDSFNHDSHDTVTNTTNTSVANNNSFNEDSGNTLVNDSNNSVSDSGNTTTETNTTTNTTVVNDESVDNSNQDNSTNTDVDIDADIDITEDRVVPVLTQA